ncbi:unnamed protein product [Caenorhabditis auriculariae]|uniref:Uncharacterized protein n=1 Tax=Caenorhabditis auriculariae TaxID=2777116 RepID=A0A8S1GVN8_9PELO|nr:unnamed protein product [Caenorhabditis auriculariae]
MHNNRIGTLKNDAEITAKLAALADHLTAKVSETNHRFRSLSHDVKYFEHRMGKAETLLRILSHEKFVEQVTEEEEFGKRRYASPRRFQPVDPVQIVQNAILASEVLLSRQETYKLPEPIPVKQKTTTTTNFETSTGEIDGGLKSDASKKLAAKLLRDARETKDDSFQVDAVKRHAPQIVKKSTLSTEVASRKSSATSSVQAEESEKSQVIPEEEDLFVPMKKESTQDEHDVQNLSLQNKKDDSYNVGINSAVISTGDLLHGIKSLKKTSKGKEGSADREKVAPKENRSKLSSVTASHVSVQKPQKSPLTTRNEVSNGPSSSERNAAPLFTDSDSEPLFGTKNIPKKSEPAPTKVSQNESKKAPTVRSLFSDSDDDFSDLFKSKLVNHSSGGNDKNVILPAAKMILNCKNETAEKLPNPSDLRTETAHQRKTESVLTIPKKKKMISLFDSDDSDSEDLFRSAKNAKLIPKTIQQSKEVWKKSEKNDPIEPSKSTAKATIENKSSKKFSFLSDSSDDDLFSSARAKKAVVPSQSVTAIQIIEKNQKKQLFLKKIYLKNLLQAKSRLSNGPKTASSLAITSDEKEVGYLDSAAPNHLINMLKSRPRKARPGNRLKSVKNNEVIEKESATEEVIYDPLSANI